MYKHLVLFLLFLLRFSPVGYSDQVADEFSHSESETILVTAMAFGDDPFDGLRCVDSSGVETAIVFRPYQRSNIVLVDRETDVLEFFKERIDIEGNAAQELVARADLRGVKERALLVFLPERRSTHELPYNVLVSDESGEAYKPGEFRFLNLTGVELGFQLGDNTAVLGQGISEDVSVPLIKNSIHPIKFAVETSSGWRTVYSTNTMTNTSSGTLIICLPPLTANSLDIRVRSYRTVPVKY